MPLTCHKNRSLLPHIVLQKEEWCLQGIKWLSFKLPLSGFAPCISAVPSRPQFSEPEHHSSSGSEEPSLLKTTANRFIRAKTSTEEQLKEGEETVRSVWGHKLRALISKSRWQCTPKEMSCTSHLFSPGVDRGRGERIAFWLVFIYWSALHIDCLSSSSTPRTLLETLPDSLINELWGGPASLVLSTALSIGCALKV